MAKFHKTHFTVSKDMPWKKKENKMNDEENDMTTSFDYEILGECQYPIQSSIGPYYESDCREPATYKVNWYYYEGDKELYKEEMLVCIEHFKKVLEEEKEIDLG